MSSVLLFVLRGQEDVAQMPVSLRCVQYMVTSVLRDQQYMLGVKSLFMVTKVLLIRNNLQGRRVVSTTGSDATITAVNSLIQSDRRLIG